MVKTIANVSLPFALIDEGDYDVSLNGKVAKISIKLEQTPSRMDQMIGMTFSASGSGSVKMENDFHGMVNISRVRIEFPYYILPTKTVPNPDGSQKDVFGDHQKNVQKECILYINRLVDVIRWYTRRYWIANLTGSDVYLNNFDLFNDIGKNVGGQIHGSPVITLFSIPNLAVSQSDIQTDISKSLQNEDRIPVYDYLYLEALEDFSKGKFNKAVMTINTALEAATSDYLYEYLIKDGKDKDEAKEIVDKIVSFGKKKNKKSGFHRILTEDFKEITGRSLEDDNELWKAFNDVRLKRKTTLHPYVGRLSEKQGKQVIITVSKIMNWILQQDRFATFLN